MRKIIESTLVSLDGAIAGPHLWAMEYFDSEAKTHPGPHYGVSIEVRPSWRDPHAQAAQPPTTSR